MKQLFETIMFLNTIKELYAPCKHTQVTEYNICVDCGENAA